jgi:hypothetical protein
MVYEGTRHWPSREGGEWRIPPPRSAYGFQMLAVEYFARAAGQQYGLPWTIVRPFNCVGAGEYEPVRDVAGAPGNRALVLSHVVPDLVRRSLTGQDPLRILGSGDQLRHCACRPAAGAPAGCRPDGARAARGGHRIPALPGPGNRRAAAARSWPAGWNPAN